MATEELEAPSPSEDDLEQPVLISGGEVRVDGRTEPDAGRRITETLGQLLQVKNFSLLLGAGASYHIGAPKIRAMSMSDVLRALRQSPSAPSEEQVNLVPRLLESDSVDLELLLTVLSTSIAYAHSVGTDEVPIRGSEVTLKDLEALQTSINHWLVAACDLPRANEEDAWQAHREFFRKILRARRLNLPRVKVFTTNYDLAIERALDDAGLPYLDGFSGSVDRTFRPETYDRDLYVLPEPAERRLVRVPGLLYLYKLHGSINWRSRQSKSGRGTSTVVQVAIPNPVHDELALIYPTPEKEKDVLGYPYSDLLRLFSSALTTPETALLVIGFGFGDDHINRLIFQAMSSNPTLQLFVVQPFRVLEERVADEAEQGVVSALSRVKDARISVLTGESARFEQFQAGLLPDPESPEAAGNQEETNRDLQNALLREPEASNEGLT